MRWTRTTLPPRPHHTRRNSDPHHHHTNHPATSPEAISSNTRPNPRDGSMVRQGALTVGLPGSEAVAVVRAHGHASHGHAAPTPGRTATPTSRGTPQAGRG